MRGVVVEKSFIKFQKDLVVDQRNARGDPLRIASTGRMRCGRVPGLAKTLTW